MDENAKAIKSVMILNIITVVVVVVLLGLQVYQMVTAKPSLAPIDQQKQAQKPSDSTGASQNQQQNQQSAPVVQQQNGTMPTGQAPMGGQQSIKCGDNVCDTLETANPNLCPKDCSK